MTGRQHTGLARRVVFELTPGDGIPGVPVEVVLSYDPRDPLAVRARFARGHKAPVVWVFARDLLAAGLHGPAGVGDIYVAPARRPGRVELDLISPDGYAAFTAPASELAEFLRAAYRLVPRGAEYAGTDLDAELRALLDQDNHH